MMTTHSLPDDQLTTALGETISCPNRLFAGNESYAGITVGFPELLVGGTRFYVMSICHFVQICETISLFHSGNLTQ
jgi:hypothetical protein